MDQAFITLAEKSVVGAGFLYLLYYVVQHLNKVSSILEKISDTMLKIDMRLGLLESRVGKLEEEGEVHGRQL